MRDPIKLKGVRLSPAPDASSTIAPVAVGMWLLLATHFGWGNQADAQTTMPAGGPQFSSTTTTFPMSLRPSSRVTPAGIPLGSTEIATPGISPTLATPGAPNCSSSSAPLFDSGGLSGGSSMSCGAYEPRSASPRSRTSVGRTGIPLGATELGDRGLSAAPIAVLPSVSPVGSNAPGGGTPCPTMMIQGSPTMTSVRSGC